MKLGIIITIVVIFIGAGVFFLYTNSSKNNPSPARLQNETVKTSNPKGSDISPNGFYGFYSPETFKNSNASKKILYFFATWCPECKEADEDFKTNVDKLPEGIAVFKIHYNDPETSPEDKNLAKKYGIVYQHTFVQVDNEGQEITKWNGGGLDKLLSSIK